MDGFDKYARQTALPDFGVEGQRRLKASRVVLIGVGGVGSAVLPLLAGAGIGEVLVVDCDTVSSTNLHRQTLYGHGDIGKPKAELACIRGCLMNPDVNVRSLNARLGSGDALFDEFVKCSLCIDATDSFSARMAISGACKKNEIPQIMASAQGYVSQMFLFGKGFYLPDLLAQDESAASEKSAGAPIFGPAAHLAGVWAAGQALRFLSGAEPEFNAGLFRHFDFSTGRAFSCNLRNG